MTGQRFAIVTAVSRGIGAAIARELASRDYGLVLMSRGEEVMDLARELGATGFLGSVTEPQDLESLVETALAQHNRTDAVVNNTGHPPEGDLLSISDEDWHAGLDLLLLNVVRMARVVTPVMVKQQGRALVDISTFSAFEPSPSFPVSSSLRAALGSFAKLFADRYAPDGIRMNNVLPGFMDSCEIGGAIRNSIPMGRRSRVTGLGKTVAFLLSPGASYITGQNLRVDGGLTRSV